MSGFGPTRTFWNVRFRAAVESIADIERAYPQLLIHECGSMPKTELESGPTIGASLVHLPVGRRHSNRICHSCLWDGRIKEAFVVSL